MNAHFNALETICDYGTTFYIHVLKNTKLATTCINIRTDKNVKTNQKTLR